MKAEAIRTFIAVPFAVAMTHRIGQLQQELKTCAARVRWVKPENIHLTLKFLGEIEPAALATVLDVVPRAVEGCRSFQCVLSGVGAFPNRHRPRVIWVGIAQGREQLSALQARIDSALVKKGFPAEKRAFSPHLTIGRVKSNRGIQPLVDKVGKVAFATPPVVVEQIVVFRSDLRPDGPVYSPLKEVRFGA